MKSIIIVIIAVLAALVPPVGAANTVTRAGNVVTISAIDSDWLWSDTFSDTSGVRVLVIVFKPGAANDVLAIKDTSDAGPSFGPLLATDAEPRVLPLFGARVRPMIDFSACTLTAGASVTLVTND